MRQLSLTDASFLYCESAVQPMHIAGLQILEVPIARRNSFFASLKRYYAERVHQIPFFTHRVVNVPFNVDHPVWEYCGADIDHHIRHMALPAPGSMAQLEQLIAQLHEAPLDRSRPLWQYTLIEGLEGSRVAWYTKMHHAAIDGMAGQALIDVLYSETPEDPAPLESPLPPSVSTRAQRLTTATQNVFLQPLKWLSESTSRWQGLTALMERVMRRQSFGAYEQIAPHTRFNTTVGSHRAFAVGTWPLGEIKALGKQHGATINDVVMAISAEALRRYLLAHGDQIRQPLVAGVPVSLRQPGDETLNNQVSMLLCSLETHVVDPLERLRGIAQSALTGKKVLPLIAPFLQSNLHVAGLPAMMTAAMQNAAYLPSGLPMPALVNIVISNVPGPRKTKYLHGARMLTHYPVSIAAHGNALNLTVQSYGDRLDYSVTACREAVPDADRLRDYLADAWKDLKSAADHAFNVAASANSQRAA